MDAEEVEGGAEEAGVGAGGRAAEGRGPRQGVLRVPMPRSLSHACGVALLVAIGALRCLNAPPMLVFSDAAPPLGARAADGQVPHARRRVAQVRELARRRQESVHVKDH